jgi:hypothetical protein
MLFIGHPQRRTVSTPEEKHLSQASTKPGGLGAVHAPGPSPTPISKTHVKLRASAAGLLLVITSARWERSAARGEIEA